MPRTGSRTRRQRHGERGRRHSIQTRRRQRQASHRMRHTRRLQRRQSCSDESTLVTGVNENSAPEKLARRLLVSRGIVNNDHNRLKTPDNRARRSKNRISNRTGARKNTQPHSVSSKRATEPRTCNS
jgi:hypothetical protein